MGIELIDKIVAKNDAFRVLLEAIGLGRGTMISKTTPVADDEILAFDSEDSDTPITVKFSKFGGGGGTTDHAALTTNSLKLANSLHTFTPDENSTEEDLNITAQSVYSRVFDRTQGDYTVRAESSKTRVVFFGDSNVWSSDSFIQLPGRSYWHHKLQDSLRRQNYYSINQGVGGNLMSGLLARFDRDVADRYVEDARNILIILCGANDANSAISTNDYWTDLESMTSQAQVLGYEVFVCLYPPINGNSTLSGRIENGSTGYNDKILLEESTEGYITIDINDLVSTDRLNWDKTDGIDYTINTVSATNVIQLVGDHTETFIDGESLVISGSSNGNDGVYDVTSSVINSGNTDVTVDQATLNTGADTGTINMSWVKFDTVHWTMAGNQWVAYFVETFIYDFLETRTHTQASGSTQYFGKKNQTNIKLESNSTTDIYYGVLNYTDILNSKDINQVAGFEGANFASSGGGTVSVAAGGAFYNDFSGSITNGGVMVGLLGTGALLNAGATCTLAASFYANPSTGGTITTSAGFYAPNFSVSTYPIYTNSGLVHLGDDVEVIGELDLTNGLTFAGGAYSLDLNGDADIRDLDARFGTFTSLLTMAAGGKVSGSNKIEFFDTQSYIGFIGAGLVVNSTGMSETNFKDFISTGTTEYQTLTGGGLADTEHGHATNLEVIADSVANLTVGGSNAIADLPGKVQMFYVNAGTGTLNLPVTTAIGNGFQCYFFLLTAGVVLTGTGGDLVAYSGTVGGTYSPGQYEVVKAISTSGAWVMLRG